MKKEDVKKHNAFDNLKEMGHVLPEGMQWDGQYCVELDNGRCIYGPITEFTHNLARISKQIIKVGNVIVFCHHIAAMFPTWEPKPKK